MTSQPMGMVDSKDHTHIVDPDNPRAWVRAASAVRLEEAR